MDLASLAALFATTYSADPNERKSGELQIRKIGKEEGMITALLQIVAEPNLDLPTRQAIVLWIKNRVKSCYHLTSPRTTELVPIPSTDKSALRSSLLHLIATAPNRVISIQIGETLKNVVSADLPNGEYAQVMDGIKELLASGDIRQVHAGCAASLEVVKAFALRMKTDMMPRIVSALFPSLVEIGGRMMTSATTTPSEQQEIAEMLHLIVKTYRTSIQLSLPAHLRSPESLLPWGRLLFSLVTYVPVDREENEWWKAKKWAYKTIARLFHKYGNPSQLPSSLQDEYGKFADNFVKEFVPEVVRIYLGQVEGFVKGEMWLSDRCICQIFNFFTECIKPKSTWLLIKPHFTSIVSTFVFPQLCFSEKKQQEWDEDPVDFVRVALDEFELYQSPVSSASSFLFSLAGNRTRTTFMPILTFINGVLRESTNPLEKFGALKVTSSLAPWIMKHPEVSGGMEGFVTQYVLPLFDESKKAEPYLRYIGCEVLASLVKFRIKFSSPETLQKTFHACLSSLDDPEIPVRVQGALGLVELVRRQGEAIHTPLVPLIPQLIQSLLKLMDDTDLELLNSCMEIIVTRFGKELVESGVVVSGVVGRLCETYTRYLNEVISATPEVTTSPTGEIIIGDSSGGGEEEEDKTYSAIGLLGTIGSVIEAVDASPELLAQIQEVVLPVLIMTLEGNALDLYDHVYELIDSLTFRLKVISPSMWRVFEVTYKAFKSNAVDFLDEMLPALDNFVSYGGDVFKTRGDYRQMVLDVYTTSLNSEHLGENDRVNGSKIAESILLNLRGGADDCLQPIVLASLDLMDKEESRSLKLANLEVVINTILYNPPVSLGIMEGMRPGLARKFFDKWINVIHNGSTPKGLPRVHDKKLTLVTLCSLLEMRGDSIPESLRGGWVGLVAVALIVFRDYPKTVELRKKLGEALSEGDDEDEDDDIDDSVLNMNEEEEDVWDEDSAYLELLANESTRQRERLERDSSTVRVGGDEAEDDGDGDDDDDDDDEDEDHFGEDLGFFTPLDRVDPYHVFKNAMHAFQINNPHMYESAMAGLSAEDQTFIVEVVRIADANVAAQAGGSA